MPVSGSNGAQYTVTAADGSGDGTLVLDFTGTNVRDLAGNALPGGAFQTGQAVSGVAGHVTAVDLNGDGSPDLICESSNGTLAVMISNGDGTFKAPVTYAVGNNPNGISVGDVNGDGIPDIVVSDYVSTGTGSTLLGNGDGTFKPAIVSATDSSYPAVSALADLNGDGKLDLIVSNTANRGGVSILLGNGDGTFTPKAVLSSDGDPGAVAVGDLNGDGIPDAVFTNEAYGSQDVQVYLGKGDGAFVEAAPVAASTSSYTVALADLNGDGKEDLIFTSPNNTVSVALGDGDGTFQSPVSYAAGIGDVTVTDVNGDAKLDVVVTNAASNTVSVLLGNGDGTLQPAQQFVAGNGAGWVTAADFNGDGRPDLAVADFSSGSLSVLLNNPPTVTGSTYTIDQDSVEQAALKLTVNGGTPISAAKAGAVPFTIAGLESDDNGSVSFSDGSHAPVVVTIVNGVPAASTVNLSGLNDGADHGDAASEQRRRRKFLHQRSSQLRRSIKTAASRRR